MATHSISTQGVGAEYFTAKAGNSPYVGYPCRISANQTVTTSSASGDFCGFITAARGGLATVQYRGFVTTTYTGSAPSLGYSILQANGVGGVKSATEGRSYLVTRIDTANRSIDLLL